MKQILTIAILSLMALTACEQVDLTEETPQEQEQQQKTKDVTFVMKGLSVDYSTRATLQSENMTDLWVYEGQTLLKHQISADSDFGQPTISLTYGSHDLTFVASKSQGQSFSTTWSCTKVADTFGKVMNVTVSKGSSTSRQVELKRVNAKVMWTIEDAVPQDASKMKVRVGNCLGLDAALAGVGSQTYETEISITSWVGAKNKQPYVMLLPAVYDEECDVTAFIGFYDASGAVIQEYSVDTKVKSNRCTNIHGEFFPTGAQGSNAVSLSTTWLDTFNVDL